MEIIIKHAPPYNRRGDLMIAAGCYPKDQMEKFHARNGRAIMPQNK
jgi:hypothetical protein